MSFLSVCERIGHYVVGATPALVALTPEVDLIPGVGTAYGLVLNAILAAEKAFPASGLGAQKKALVTQSIQLAAPGAFDSAKLSDAIDAAVTALKALAAALPAEGSVK